MRSSLYSFRDPGVKWPSIMTAGCKSRLDESDQISIVLEPEGENLIRLWRLKTDGERDKKMTIYPNHALIHMEHLRRQLSLVYVLS